MRKRTMDGTRSDPRRRGLVATRTAAILAVVTVIVTCVALVVRLPGAPAESGEPVVRAYVLPGGDFQAANRRVQDRFGKANGVRIAVDGRTRQILVSAPPQTHAEIARLLGTNQVRGNSISNKAAATRRSEPAVATGNHPLRDTRPTSDSLALQHINGDQLERALKQLLGESLPATFSPDGSQISIPLQTPTGQRAALSIDRRRQRVQIEGPEALRRSWLRLLTAYDRRPSTESDRTEVLPLQFSQRDQVKYALAALQNASAREPSGGQVRPGGNAIGALAQLGQDAPPAVARPGEPPSDPQAGEPVAGAGEAAAAEDAEAPAADAADAAGAGPGGDGAGFLGGEQSGNLIGEVQVELLDGLDVIVVRGHRRDVERIVAIIDEIERLSAETEPVITVFPLQHVDSDALVQMAIVLYEQSLAPRSGQVSMTALVKPNSVLLIGRPEGVNAAQDLIRRLDQSVDPDTQFRVFQLKHAAAAAVQETVTEFYEERGGLGTRLRVVADYRSNALIVQGSPRDLAEIAGLIEDIDVLQNAAMNELKVFRLRNSLADELAPIIQEAINGDAARTGATGQGAGTSRTDQVRSSMLSFLTLDARGGKLLESGILSDVRVTADARANALLVTGPPSSMPLIAALIEQLDGLPSAVAQIKVFTIVNGDAVNMAEMLTELFENQTSEGLPVVLAGADADGTSLVPLRFSVDERTNSIIASGSSGDLSVVEAILLRLDESEISQRESTVYRLRNAPAVEVAAAINELLQSERQVEEIGIEQVSPFRQMEREVIVVPEPVTNSLIISSTPRFFEDMMKLVEQLDERPPMVVIQVLLAAVRLGCDEEFGIELGLQDSLLFDRSIAGSGDTAGQVVPGFLFNNQQLGNSSGTTGTGAVGSQALSSFGLGRVTDTLGYGGLVLSASSDSVSVLIRALQQKQRLQVLSRPQVMTLDNQAAFVLVGQRVPRVGSLQNTTAGGTISNTVLDNVGIILGVTPRISPDGLVVMEIDAERSELSDEAVPIGIAADGGVVEQRIIDVVTAQTTVSALSGQTVILGGLITTNSAVVNRKVPFLGDVPVAGHLFRYDSNEEQRNELLIIMTPHIVDDEEDAEWIKQVESQRMNWCLADVVDVHGEGVLSGVRNNWNENWDDHPTDVIYPDREPTLPEPLPPADDLPAEPPLPRDDLSSVRAQRRAPPLPVDAVDARPIQASTAAHEGQQLRYRGDSREVPRTSIRMQTRDNGHNSVGTPDSRVVAPSRYDSTPYDPRAAGVSAPYREPTGSSWTASRESRVRGASYERRASDPVIDNRPMRLPPAPDDRYRRYDDRYPSNGDWTR